MLVLSLVCIRATVQRILTAVCLGLNREGIWVAYNVELHALLRPVALGLKALGVFLRNEDCGKVVGYDLLADVPVGAGDVPSGLDRVAGADGSSEGEKRKREVHGGGCGRLFLRLPFD
jgi:hypothetical protein